MHRAILPLLLLMTSCALKSAEWVVFLGTSTQAGASKGIYAFRFDPESEKAGSVSLVAEASSPGFLAEHPGKPILYAVGSDPASKAGIVTAYRIDPALPGLAKIGSTSAGTPGAPCHVVATQDARNLLLAYYNIGMVSAVSLNPDGSLGSLVSKNKHEGQTGPNAQRQECPHAHSFTVSKDGRYAFAMDLGMDRIFRYALDPSQPGFKSSAPVVTVCAPGVGPRHAKFSADGRFLYVLNELAGSMDVFAYEASDGSLSHLQSISTLEPDFAGTNTSAEVQIHPNGRFVYASNRGPDTLAVFRRDEKSGLLTLVEHVPSGGRHPRHYALSPDGSFLLCANRDTNNVAVFRVNADTGRLTQTKLVIEAPSPTFVLFAR